MAWSPEEVVGRLRAQLLRYGVSATTAVDLQEVRLRDGAVEVLFRTPDAAQHGSRFPLDFACDCDAEGVATVVRTNLTEDVDAADRGLPAQSPESRTW